MEEAWEEEEVRAGQLAEPLHVSFSTGAGGCEKPRPRRARWLDVLRYIWMYARGFACSVGRVLFFLRRESTAAAAGVVVAAERNGRHKNHGQQCNYAFMYGKQPKHQARVSASIDELHDDDGPDAKKSRKQSDDKVDVLEGRRSDKSMQDDDLTLQVSNSATATDLPPTPASPLMVGDERVWGEELRLFAYYCEQSLTCRKRILCHRCIFEPHDYCPTDKFLPPGMLLHSMDVHRSPGLVCTSKTCMVRVGTPRELLLHIHFCHELNTGWWKLKLYREKMKVMKTN